ncbi:MAG: helix-turn-helix domain-containing protein [Tenericutes bacterium]|nr:helix-turn-helix domain-containing protein [Mycoplasmatota bacterium]
MAISDNIRICRIQKKLTQKQLGDLLYVSDKTISKWESGRSVPDIITIKKIADILEVDYGLLIDGEHYSDGKNNSWNKIIIFFNSHKHLLISSTILFLGLIFILLAPTKVTYFMSMISLFLYTIYLTVKYSRWYAINSMVLIFVFTIIISSWVQFELIYLFTAIFFIGIVMMMIIYIIKQNKLKDDIFLVDFLGNWNLLLATFIYLSSFTIKYTTINSETVILVNKQPGFIIYVFCLILLLFLHQYLYVNKNYQDKVVKNIKGKLLSVSGVSILILLLSVITATSIKLTVGHIDMSSIYVWKSYYDDSFTDEQTNAIIDLYGKENVTLSRYVEITSELQIYAYTSNFIENGVVVNTVSSLNHIEQVSLLYGEVWEEDSTKKVIVIDKDTALNTFGKVDAVGELISINQEQWKVIGVVSNTKAAESFLERAVSNGVDPNELQIDSYVYIPFHFKDYPSFEIAHEEYDFYVIRTQKFISGDADEKKIIDILVDGNNFDNFYGDRLLKIGTITGSDILLEYLDIKVGLLISSSLLVIAISTSELLRYVQKSKKEFER